MSDNTQAPGASRREQIVHVVLAICSGPTNRGLCSRTSRIAPEVDRANTRYATAVTVAAEAHEVGYQHSQVATGPGTGLLEQQQARLCQICLDIDEKD